MKLQQKEDELRRLGFKKHWNGDRSGYWFEYTIRNPLGRFLVTADPSREFDTLYVTFTGRYPLDKYHSATNFLASKFNLQRIIKICNYLARIGSKI